MDVEPLYRNAPRTVLSFLKLVCNPSGRPLSQSESMGSYGPFCRRKVYRFLNDRREAQTGGILAEPEDGECSE